MTLRQTRVVRRMAFARRDDDGSDGGGCFLAFILLLVIIGLVFTDACSATMRRLDCASGIKTACDAISKSYEGKK